MNRTVPALAGFLLASALLAQESPNYRISDSALNAGGHPADGVTLTSPSYHITLDAVGDAVAAIGLASPSYRMDAGFPECYPPPGEVHGLLFADVQTLVWDPEPSAGDYNLYRDLFSNLTGPGYGSCDQKDIAGASTTDGDMPPGEDGYFYLVTVENRLDEEGPKGRDSAGDERPNPSPCL